MVLTIGSHILLRKKYLGLESSVIRRARLYNFHYPTKFENSEKSETLSLFENLKTLYSLEIEPMEGDPKLFRVDFTFSLISEVLLKGYIYG